MHDMVWKINKAMHNDYTFQCFIEDIVKKKQQNFLALISLI